MLHWIQRGRRRQAGLWLMALAAILAVWGVATHSTDERAPWVANAGLQPTVAPTASVGSDRPLVRPGVPTGRRTSNDVPDLPDTADPDTYAAAVAAVLYGMNQRDDDAPAYWDLLRTARDPAAEEIIPAMTERNFDAALRTRIPDEYMWQRMRDSQQWSEFTVSNVWEPEYIRTKYATGDAPAAAVMRNVAGTETLHFLDEAGVEVSRTRQVTVSILMVCAPARPRCALLGVSAGVVQ